MLNCWFGVVCLLAIGGGVYGWSCRPHPCGHGVCVDISTTESNRLGVGEYNCICPDGWTGKNCETQNVTFCNDTRLVKRPVTCDFFYRDGGGKIIGGDITFEFLPPEPSSTITPTPRRSLLGSSFSATSAVSEFARQQVPPLFTWSSPFKIEQKFEISQVITKVSYDSLSQIIWLWNDKVMNPCQLMKGKDNLNQHLFQYYQLPRDWSVFTCQGSDVRLSIENKIPTITFMYHPNRICGQLFAHSDGQDELKNGVIRMFSVDFNFVLHSMLPEARRRHRNICLQYGPFPNSLLNQDKTVLASLHICDQIPQKKFPCPTIDYNM
jgi:hypothetical protein